MTPFIQFKSHDGLLDVRHLLSCLGWTKGWQELRKAITATESLAKNYTCEFGVGVPGPYELMLAPRLNRCAFRLLLHGRPLATMTDDDATRLLSHISLNGTSPIAIRSLYMDMQRTLDLARQYEVPVELGYTGLSKLIVKPTGDYFVVPHIGTTELVFAEGACPC